MLIIHFIGLTMGLGTSFAMLFLGKALILGIVGGAS